MKWTGGFYFQAHWINNLHLKTVLIYIGGLSSCERGAVGTHTRGILHAFLKSRRFSTCHLIGSSLDCFTDSELAKHDLSYLGIPQGTLLNKWQFYNRYIHAILSQVKDILREHTGSHILIYHRYSPAISPGLFKKMKGIDIKSIQLVLEYNDLTIEQLKFAAQNKAWSPLNAWLRVNPVSLSILHLKERNCFRLADIVVCVTEKLCDYVNQISGKNHAIRVENATDKNLILKYQSSDRTEVRNRLHMLSNTFYMVHAGTLTYWDGLAELLSALSRTKNRNKIKLLIIGEGAMKSSLMNITRNLKLEGNVEFMDAMPFEQVLEYVFAADLIPLLKTITSYQLSPIKYYESLGLGKYILATDVPYIQEAAQIELGATVSLPLDVERVAVVLDQLYENHGKLMALSDAIQTYALTNHTWTKRVETILDSLDDLPILL